MTLNNQVASDRDDIDLLLSSIFAQFPAVYIKTEDQRARPTRQSPRGKFTIPSDEWLTLEFYGSAYAAPRLTKDIQGAEISTNNFVELVVGDNSSGDRNTLFFLQGDVGSGKTAFVNYIITTAGQRMFLKERVWFVRYNVDVNRTPDEKLSLKETFSGICSKVARIVEKILASHPGKVKAVSEELLAQVRMLRNIPDEATLEVVKSTFFEAANAIGRLLDRRLVLLLDNLDSFFHQDERYQFLPGARFADRSSINVLHELVTSFYMSNGATSRLGASIVFVLRPESYIVLERSRDYYQGIENPFNNRKNLITLHRPDSAQVVSGRISLLKKMVARILPAVRRVQVEGSISTFISALESQLARSSSEGGRSTTIDALVSISNQGIRDVLKFFHNHLQITNWLDSTARPIEFGRYIQYKPIGLIAFMMQGKCKFSQVSARFPNAFLVNLEALDDEISYLKNDGTEAKVETAHVHSYWLKYLLLRYIQEGNLAGRSVKEEDILETFCGPENIAGFYPETMVRVALGSLSERNVSNLIEVDRTIFNGGKIVKSNIKLNKRAEFCLKEIFFKFFYLQLVVDDWALPLPAHFSKYKLDLNYSYLTLSDPAYHIEAAKVVENKAELVCRFIGLLFSALEAEKDKFNSVFETLERIGVSLPDRSSVVDGVVAEIGAVARQLGIFSGVQVRDAARLRGLSATEFDQCATILASVYD